MSRHPYRPRPLDTSGVQLGPELTHLIERLAENNHELWAQGRMAEGWVYGPARNDERKEHPFLVPYEELPEGEKHYDRVMAVETLRAILALGFQIQPPAAEVSGGEVGGRDAFTELREVHSVLASPAPLSVNELLAIWRAHEERLWRTEPDLYALLARRFLKLGDPLIAHEVLAEARRGPSREPRLDHLFGLALARSGAVGQANEVARELAASVAGDPALLEEVLGLLGRTHKDLAHGAKSPRERERHLARAVAAYREAFQQTRGSYSGINAATVALLLDRRAEAESLARQVREAALAELEATRRRGGDPYWQLATLGEAALILGDDGEAERWYSQALRGGGQSYGDFASTRRQARLIAGHRGADPGWLDTLLRVPRVVVFAGHMIDRPDQPAPRFPPEAEGQVAAALEARLRELDAGFGFSGASCGSDILFLEAMGRLNGQTSVVLPFPQAGFIESYVDVVPTGNWVARFHRALSRAAEVVVASGAPFPAGSVLFEYGSLLMLGLAAMHSRALETELIPLAIWDGREASTDTAAVVRSWRECGHRVELIPLPEMANAG